MVTIFVSVSMYACMYVCLYVCLYVHDDDGDDHNDDGNDDNTNPFCLKLVSIDKLSLTEVCFESSLSDAARRRRRLSSIAQLALQISIEVTVGSGGTTMLRQGKCGVAGNACRRGRSGVQA